MKQRKNDSSVSLGGLWDMLLYFASFRREMPVTEVMVFRGNDSYYVCPRCSITVEREFLGFCDRCGQHLGWNDYETAREIYPGPQNSASS